MDELTAARRAVLRERIEQERERAAARAAALTRDFDDIVASSADAVRDDEHDPEGATIAFERAQVAALLAETQELLVALEVAAARLGDPDAGRCRTCTAAIGYERLLARPATQQCIRCASAADPRRG